MPDAASAAPSTAPLAAPDAAPFRTLPTAFLALLKIPEVDLAFRDFFEVERFPDDLPAFFFVLFLVAILILPRIASVNITPSQTTREVDLFCLQRHPALFALPMLVFGDRQ